MNFAHLHLIINHIPLIGIPVALLFLLYGIWTKNAPTQRFSLYVLVGLAAMVLPVYLTGEPAEDVVEHLPGVVESFIESHEEAAEVSLVLTLATGCLALLALWFQKNEMKRQRLNPIVIGTAAIALISLAYTANLGGKIRHTELRSDHNTNSIDIAPSSEERGDDHD